MIIGCTGHRPPRLGMGYDDESSILTFNAFASDVLRSLGRVETLISGMALGWDLAMAEAALELKIDLIAAIPFNGANSRWSLKARKRQEKILSKAKEVKIICGDHDKRGYTDKYLERDRFIVDNSNLLVALWDGDKTGGTWQTIKYAQREKVKVKNIYDHWIDEGRPGVRHI